MTRRSKWLKLPMFLAVVVSLVSPVSPTARATDVVRAAQPAAVPSLLSPALLAPSATVWSDEARGAIRGITIGPIENSLHPNRGYGSAACARAMHEAKRMGATWVSITPFGRVWDLAPGGISLTFERPFVRNREDVTRAVDQAHAAGLRVLLVPHLWVETGGWRGEIEPGDDAAWQRWAEAYKRFLLEWAKVAARARADMLAVGVELRSWVTTEHAPSFVEIVRDVRSVYPGLLTYAGNWDDIEQTVTLGEIDVIGVNAFYPLAEQNGARLPALLEGGRKVAARVHALAELWHKPVIFTEFGYTTRSDPAVRPWEWPEHLAHISADEAAQADAYRALLGPLLDEPAFAGFFMWRLFADPDDQSQEPDWGFSPRGKLAELVLRNAFAAHWAGDGPDSTGAALLRPDVDRIGVY